MTTVNVKDIKIEHFTPKLADPIANKLLPTKFHPSRMEFKLIGAHVGIANGLRRAITSEIPVKCLYFELEDFDCTEPYMLNDFIQDRVRQIPIDQNISEDARFELDVKNDGDEMLAVSSADLKIKNGAKTLPCNETFTIAKIAPGKYIRIKNIKILRGYGYEHGGFSVARNALARALDQEPYNFYTEKGISSLVSDPQEYLLAFNTNGTMAPPEIVILACDEIIRRLEQIRAQLVNIHSSPEGSVHILAIGGENYTTGNAIMKTMCDTFTEVCTFKYNPTSKVAEWSLKTGPKSPAPVKIFDTVISKCVAVFEQIRAQISKAKR